MMMSMIPIRGNFGGISLSKRATLCLNLDEIHGALFDHSRSELILVGKKRIQLPSMRLDDLAVAIQSIYGLKGIPAEDPGVSIEPVKDGQIVRYFGQTAGTEFGKILFEGDLTLKRLVLGEYSCMVPGFLPYSELFWKNAINLSSGCALRTWIVPERITLTQSMDGSAMIFNETIMRCLTETKCSGNLYQNKAHELFVNFFTDHYDEISVEYPIFSEIKRLGQISGLVKWLKENQIPFDLSFFESYIPKEVFTPELLPSVTKHIIHNQHFLNLSGGIHYALGTDNFLKKTDREIDQFKQNVIDSRPTDHPLNWEYENLSAQAFPLISTRKTGDLRLAFIDLELPKSFTLNRYYDSFSDEDIGFGRGWTILPFQIMTSLKKNSPVVIIREENKHWVYTLKDGVYYREDSLQKLIQNPHGLWILYLQNGQTAIFDPQARLYEYWDFKNGKKITFSYQSDQVIEIRNSLNHCGDIKLSYLGNRIVKAVASNGSTAIYEYDNANQLAKVCNKTGKVKISYGYDSDHRLTRMAAPNGDIVFRGKYNDYHQLISEKWNFLPTYKK